MCRTSPLDPFLKAARWIGRSQDPFANFCIVFHAGLKEDGLGDEEDVDADAEGLGP